MKAVNAAHLNCGDNAQSVAPRSEHGTDATLVDELGRQNYAALADAYAKHAGRVHALARAVCGEAPAADVTHEVFMRLWNTPSDYDTESGSLRGYLLIQAHRRAIDMFGTTASVRVDRADVGERLTALHGPEGQAVALAYFGGFTYREVARLLGTADSKVRNHIRNGLRQLRIAAGAELRAG